jgi:hypothetical protein
MLTARADCAGFRMKSLNPLAALELFTKSKEMTAVTLMSLINTVSETQAGAQTCPSFTKSFRLVPCTAAALIGAYVFGRSQG